MRPPPSKALLDANVLFSIHQRNLLLQIASNNLFSVAWTALIEDEWLRNLEERTRARVAARTIPLIRSHFPQALVGGFDPSLAIGRTDPKDRHVAAAAAHIAPCFLLTWNLRHLDIEELARRNVTVETPDDFLARLYDKNPEPLHDAVREAHANLTKSAPTWGEYLNDLAGKHRLPSFVERLRRHAPSEDIELIKVVIEDSPIEPADLNDKTAEHGKK
jgi:hypothetical protein